MGHRIIRLPDLMHRTGFSRTSIYRLIKEAGFPQPIALGGQAVGWVEAEIDAWIEDRMRERQTIDSSASLAS